MGVLYRPSETKLKNTASKDYLGKAKLIAAEDEREAYTSFTGVTRLKQGLTPTGTRSEDAPKTFDAAVNLKRAATIGAFGNESNSTTLTRAPTTINVITREGGNRSAVKSSLNDGPQNPPNRSPNAVNDLRRTRSTSPKNGTTRLTDIYDQYLDDRDLPALPDPERRQRVIAWARSNSSPGQLKRKPSAAASTYVPSSFGTPMRKNTIGKRGPTPARSTVYEDEEEGGFADPGFEEPIRIRIKVCIYTFLLRCLGIHSLIFSNFRFTMTVMFVAWLLLQICLLTSSSIVSLKSSTSPSMVSG